MANPTPIWDVTSPAHRRIIRRDVLAPLIAATRPMDLRTPQAIEDAERAWLLSLADVPLEVLQVGVQALLLQGLDWMPKPLDLRKACAAHITRHRAALKAQADAITAKCEQCDGSEWAPFTDADGVERVRRCACRARSLAVMAEAPPPLALPPAREREELDA